MSARALAGLALRRALEPRTALALAVACLVAALLPVHLVEPLAGRETAAGAGLAARRALWSAALVVLAPALGLRAAGLFAGWRARERGWVGARPVGRGAALAWLAGGTWLGGALALGACALAAELVAVPLAGADESGALATRRVARLQHPALVSSGGHERAELALEPLLGGHVSRAEGHALGLRLVALPGSAPLAGARVGLRSDPAPDAAPRTALACAPEGAVALALAAGDRALVLEREPGAAFLVARDSIELLEPGVRPSAASAALLADALVAWSAWCALAVLLGAFLRPALALGACLALACLPALPGAGGVARLVPGAGLPERLELLARGLVPDAPRAADALAALGIAAAAAGLAALCARSER